MKKEDLCMLLLVVALLLIVSRNTNIFEGVDETLDEVIDETVDETVEEVVEETPPEVPTPAPLPTPEGVQQGQAQEVPPPPGSGTLPPTDEVELPPTPQPAVPPTPQEPAVPPTPKQPEPSAPTPPTPPATPPSAPEPVDNKKKVTFGGPLVDQADGAFGQGWVSAFDEDSDIYALTGGDEQYGEKIPLSLQQEYLTMKSLGTLTPEIMKNLDEKRGGGHLLGTDFKPWDPSSTSGALLDTQFKGVQISGDTPQVASVGGGDVAPVVPVGGGGQLELHMVYGDWCGHSRRAVPAFEELMKETGVRTAAGSSVKFFMTKDDSPDMKQFREVVTGFPSYMVVKADKTMEKLTEHDRSKDGIKAAVEKLNY